MATQPNKATKGANACPSIYGFVCAFSRTPFPVASQPNKATKRAKACPSIRGFVSEFSFSFCSLFCINQ